MIKEPYSQKTADELTCTAALLQRNTTLQEIMATVGVSNRRARDLISFIGQRYPVVSTSDESGYILLADKSLLTEDQILACETLCRHMIAEHKSRAKQILERVKPLETWLNS